MPSNGGSADIVKAGVLSSNDGKMVFDLDNSVLSCNNNSTYTVQINPYNLSYAVGMVIQAGDSYVKLYDTLGLDYAAIENNEGALKINQILSTVTLTSQEGFLEFNDSGTNYLGTANTVTLEGYNDVDIVAADDIGITGDIIYLTADSRTVEFKEYNSTHAVIRPQVDSGIYLGDATHKWGSINSSYRII